MRWGLGDIQLDARNLSPLEETAEQHTPPPPRERGDSDCPHLPGGQVYRTLPILQQTRSDFQKERHTDPYPEGQKDPAAPSLATEINPKRKTHRKAPLRPNAHTDTHRSTHS